MNIKAPLGVLAAVLTLGVGSSGLQAASEEGVALAIVYDTSGSMQETVRDQEGKASPKYVIANRALIAIARQIQSFVTNSAAGGGRRVEAGLFIFNSPGAREVVKFGPFDEAAFENWARAFRTPAGNTPLGNAIIIASQSVLKSSLNRKHVLVITDGMSNSGPLPDQVIPRLRRQADQNQTQLSVHFVAFDVDAKVFSSVKKLGSTVVGAADEKQLNTQLEFILQKKILLEEEETPKTGK